MRRILKESWWLGENGRRVGVPEGMFGDRPEGLDACGNAAEVGEILRVEKRESRRMCPCAGKL